MSLSNLNLTASLSMHCDYGERVGLTVLFLDLIEKRELVYRLFRWSDW